MMLLAAAAPAQAEDITIMDESGDTIDPGLDITSFTVSKRKKPAVQELLQPVGTFRFEKGKAGYVEISNTGTDGYVVIDAVQWVEAKP